MCRWVVTCVILGISYTSFRDMRERERERERERGGGEKEREIIFNIANMIKQNNTHSNMIHKNENKAINATFG